MTSATGLRIPDLAGKTVIVTGSGTGIGRALAVAFAGQEARVVVGARSPERLSGVLEEIHAAGGDAVPFAGDLRDPDAAEGIVGAAVEHFGGVDVLVNNAGGTFNARAEDITPNGFRAVVETNLTQVFLVSRAAFPHLKDSSPSSIVNIGSIAGIEPGPGHVHYSAAKAGVTHMTRVLAYEWGPSGIRVNCVSPGVVETARSAFVGHEERREAWRRRVPLGWLARPEDLVGTVLLLASEASAYTTGAIIRVDGGPRSGTAFE